MLHCDPTASHYLKIILDSVLGPANFTNEIIWQRTSSKSLMKRRLPTNHDVLLMYSRPGATWNESQAFTPYQPDLLSEKTAEKYAQLDSEGRRYQLTSLINPSSDRPNLTYEFLGVTRVWRWTRERMEQAYSEGLVVQTAPGRVPRFKRYLEDQRGVALGDVWADIPPLNSQARERLGYGRDFGISRLFFRYVKLLQRLATIAPQSALKEAQAWPQDELFDRLRLWAPGEWEFWPAEDFVRNLLDMDAAAFSVSGAGPDIVGSFTHQRPARHTGELGSFCALDIKGVPLDSGSCSLFTTRI